MTRPVHLFVIAAGLSVPGTAAAQPAAPKAKFALIEFDASRIKFVHAEAWVEKNEVRYVLGEPKDLNASPGIFRDKKLIPARVREAAADIARAYHTELCERRNIPPKHIYIIAGCQFYDLAAEEKKTIRAEIVRAIEDAAPDGWKDRKDRPKEIPFDILSPIDEFKYTSLGLRHRDEDLRSYAVVDVGMAPLKAGYFEPEGKRALPKFRGIREVIPGAMRLSDGIRDDLEKQRKDDRAEFAKALPAAVDREVGTPLRYEADAMAGFRNRDVQYIIGDAAWALAVFLKPGELLRSGDRVAVTSEDLRAFAALTLKDRNPDGSLNIPPLTHPPEWRSDDIKALTAHYNRLKDTFTPEQLASAAAALQAVGEKFRYQGKRQLYVLKDSRHVWATGYLVTLVEELLAPE